MEHIGRTAIYRWSIVGYGTSFGRNWLLPQNHTGKNLQVLTNGTLRDILDNNEIFQDESRTVKGVTAEIHTDPGSVPRFHMARSVQFALQAKFEADWSVLRSGSFEPVQFWIGLPPYSPE